MSDGPNTARVRATLATRPAGDLYQIACAAEDDFCKPEYTFAALFNGARQGWLTSDGGATFGKSEAEWGWPHAWNALRDAGLIEFTLETKPNHPSYGGYTTYVHWTITERGWEVRNDDLKWDREMAEAWRADKTLTDHPSPDRSKE